MGRREAGPFPHGPSEKSPVRPEGRALALIRKELAKKGVRYEEDEVGDVLDALYEAYESDGAVPTREAFAERCANGEVAQAVLGMGRDPFLKRKLGKRGAAAISAGCVLAVALIGGGAWWAVAAQPQDSRDAGVPVASVSEKKDADGKEKEASGDEGTGAAGGDAESAEAGTQDDGDKAAGDAAAQGTDAGKGQTGSGSTASSGNSGPASGPTDGPAVGSGSSAQAQQPAHTHNWVPVTKTVHHDAQYRTVHHDAVTRDVVICNHCGAQFGSTGEWSAHAKSLALQGVTANVSYRTEPVVVQQAYDEQVLVSDAWDETVTTGYRCSTCGAVR